MKGWPQSSAGGAAGYTNPDRGQLAGQLHVPAELDQGKAVPASKTPIWQQATVCTPSGVADSTAAVVEGCLVDERRTWRLPSKRVVMVSK